MIQTALLNVIFWSGLSSSFLVLCDLLFPEKLKWKVEHAFIAIWSWLDDVRELRILRRFQRSETNQRLIAVLHIIYVILALLVGRPLGLSGIVIGGTVAGALGSLVLCSRMRSVFYWMTSPSSVHGYLWRVLIVGGSTAIVTVIAASLVVILVALSLFLTEAFFRGDFFSNPMDAFAIRGYAAGVYALLGFLDVVLITFLGGFISVQTYYWGICIGYIVLLSMLIAVLSSLRFLFLKFAEYKKGPLLAISALATAVVAFLKFFVASTP